MRSGRLVCSRWFARCLLVGFFGLAASPAFAQNLGELACLEYASAAGNWVNGTGCCGNGGYVEIVHSCVSVVPTSGPMAGKPVYAFLGRTYNNDGFFWGNIYNAPPGSTEGGSTFPSLPSGVTTGTADGSFGSLPGVSLNPNLYRWFFSEQEEPNLCENKPGFVSRTLRAPTANGSGSVCHDGCAATVALGYIGTYPSGYLEFSFDYSGSACASEPAPTDEPLSGPLGLPPEEGGVDTDVPDPGDGTPGSSGGGTCEQPPACTGDSIQCNILFQTWASRCSGDSDRLDRIGDGVDGLGEGIDRIGDGVDSLGEGIDRIGDGVDGFRGDLASGWSDGGVGNGAGLSDLGGLTSSKNWTLDDLDISGMGFPRSCPVWGDIVFTVAATTHTIALSEFTVHCTIFEWTGYLILAFAAFWSARILLRGD